MENYDVVDYSNIDEIMMLKKTLEKHGELAVYMFECLSHVICNFSILNC